MWASIDKDGHACVCNECRTALYANCVPPASLVCVDAGVPPPELPQLTLLEQLVLAHNGISSSAARVSEVHALLTPANVCTCMHAA